MKKGQKILIADMDEKLARSAAAYLSGELFDVKVLSDTASAAERIRAFPPDAVILDPLQPKTDGLQIIRGIRQKSQVPIIVTSARSDVFSRVLALEIGADALLKGTRVDGVYTADPKIDPSAKRYDTITMQEMIDKKLAVIDLTASVLCMENHVPLAIFDLNEENSIANAMQGKINGTIVTVE